MKIKITYERLIVGIILYFLFNTPYCLGYISNSTVYFYFNVFIGVCLSLYILIKKKIKKDLFVGIKFFMIPYIIVSLFSFFTGIIFYGLSIKPYITQSFLLMFEQWTVFIVAYFLYCKEKENALKFIAIVGILSYFTVIIHYIYLGGINALIHPFNNRVNGVGLEVHGLTYMFVLLILYSWYEKGIKYILTSPLYCIVIFFIFLGNKRAAYLGAILSICLYYCLKIGLKKNKNLLFYAGYLLLIFLFIYVFVIKFGVLQYIAGKLGIKDSFRFNFWNYFNPFYKLSPLYLGRTLFFTDYYMTLPEIHKMYNFGGQGQMHNDILRTFIGWGFIPFLYYYAKMLIINFKSTNTRILFKNGWKFMPILFFFLIIEGFDNMLGSLNFNMVLYLIFYLTNANLTNANFKHKREYNKGNS